MLANPGAWADGARTLIAFFAINPRLFQLIKEEPDGDQNRLLNDIRRVQREGKNIEASITQIQHSDALFTKLIAKYEETLKEVFLFIYEQAVNLDGVEAVGDKSLNPEDALARVAGIEVMKGLVEREYKTTAPDIKDVELFPIPAGDMRYKNAEQNRVAMEGHIRWPGESCTDLAKQAIFHQLTATIEARDRHLTREEIFKNNAKALSDYRGRLRNHPILHDANYRKKRILSVVADASVDELASCKKEPGRLPHRKLMEKYFEARTHQAMNSLFRDNATNKRALDLIDALQGTIDELSIFLSFAFPKQFVSDPRLRAFLGTLWSKQSILDHVVLNKRDFIAVALQKTLEPGRELDHFRADILGRVEAAKKAQEFGFVDEYRHPLIQQVLSELVVFEHAATLAVPQAAPRTRQSRGVSLDSSSVSRVTATRANQNLTLSSQQSRVTTSQSASTSSAAFFRPTTDSSTSITDLSKTALPARSQQLPKNEQEIKSGDNPNSQIISSSSAGAPKKTGRRHR